MSMMGQLVRSLVQRKLDHDICSPSLFKTRDFSVSCEGGAGQTVGDCAHAEVEPVYVTKTITRSASLAY